MAITYLITITLLLLITSMVKSNFDPIYHNQLGVYLTPLGVAVHPTKHHILQLAIVFPHPYLGKKINKGCPQVNRNFEESIKSRTINFFQTLELLFSGKNQEILNSYCDVLPISHCSTPQIKGNKTTRTKRFLPLLATGLGIGSLGLGIFNSIESHHINSAISTLGDNQQKIKEHINKMLNVERKIEQIDADLFVKLGDFDKSIHSALIDMECNIISENQNQYMNMKISEMHNKYERIIHALFRGDLTDEILTPLEAMKVISNHQILTDSIYNQDLAMIYKLTSVIPIKFDQNTASILSLMIIPIIQEMDIAPIFEISNFGWSYLNISYQVDLPNKVAVFKHKSGTASFEMKNECVMNHGIWICPTQTLISSPRSTCINGIMNKEEDLKNSCTIQVRQSNKFTQDIRYMTSGVLFTGYNEFTLYETVRKLQLGNRRKITVPRDNWTFIPFNEFETLTLGENLIHTTPQSAVVSIIDTPADIQPIIDELSIPHINEKWINIQDLKERMISILRDTPDDLSLDEVLIHSNFRYILILTILLFGVLLALIIYFNRQLNRYKAKEEIKVLYRTADVNHGEKLMKKDIIEHL